MLERKPDRLDPLLVPTLRLLITLPITIGLLPLFLTYFFPTTMARFVLPLDVTNPAMAPFVIFELLVLFSLITPGLPARLGRHFLPLTLFFCTMGPVSALLVRALQYRIDVPVGTTPEALFTFFFQGIWPTAFYVIIPFLVIAWQYPFRYVMLFAIGLALLEVSAPLFFQRTDITWALLQFSIERTAVFTAIGYLVSQLVASQRQQQTALALANQQLTQYALTQEQLAISRERNRLARDLHDTLAHYMSGLVLELEGARLLWDADRVQAKTTLDNAVTTARTGLTETRRALRALRSTPLTDLGLTGAIRDLAESMAARNQWQLDLQLSPMPVVLSPIIDEVVYRVVQEGLTNIERHAAATTVTLTLRQTDDCLRVRIADNGAGFIQAAVDRAERFGLLGMQERAALVGGKLTVESTLGHGTVVIFTRNGQSTPWMVAQPVLPALHNGVHNGVHNGKLEVS